MKSIKQKKKQKEIPVSSGKALNANKEEKYPMINRKEVQAKIDMEKKVRWFRSLNYDNNRIAALMEIPVAKIKEIK